MNIAASAHPQLLKYKSRVNRQQEIQRICQTLLTTALDKRVAASIILGAQVNREVISFDTLNLDNMREGGDIEQDANLVLGMWNDQAGKMDNFLKRLGEIERDLQEAVDQTKQISDKKSYDINTLLFWIYL